jgi:DNA mismatch endonuclease (patch repair protein)
MWDRLDPVRRLPGRGDRGNAVRIPPQTSRATTTRTASRGDIRPFKVSERALNPSGAALLVDSTTSQRLARVRREGTAVELVVRRAVSALGLRFTTENRDLLGSPDLANRRRKWAVFVHGCYWHSHRRCPRATVPKNNRQFWLAKFARNRERDRQVQSALKRAGYVVIVVWECEVDVPRHNARRRVDLDTRFAPLVEKAKAPEGRMR